MTMLQVINTGKNSIPERDEKNSEILLCFRKRWGIVNKNQDFAD